MVFVVGPYKSGTSLLAELLAERGFVDPSSVTNPNERAYGLTVPRYLTHECATLRSVVDQLMPSRVVRGRFRLAGLPGSGGGPSPEDYLSAWRSPVVLKDPRFVYTLPRWIEAAATLGRRTCVCFTTRDAAGLEEAWRAAPFTRGLLRLGQHREMSEWARLQLAFCQRSRTPSTVTTLPELRACRSVVSADPSGIERATRLELR